MAATKNGLRISSMTQSTSSRAKAEVLSEEEMAVTIPDLDAALQKWVLQAAPGATFTLQPLLSSSVLPEKPCVHGWLQDIKPSQPVRPARGRVELKATLRYLLTVACADEGQAHAVLHSLLEAAVNLPAAPDSDPAWTLEQEPPPHSFWQACGLSLRPCLVLSTPLALPRPPARPAPPVREVRADIHPLPSAVAK